VTHPPFTAGICTGWGAWEFKARWSYIDLNDAGITGNRLSDFTFGVNWYLNPNFRVMLDYIHADLDKAAGAGAGESDANFVAMRAMFFW
jgi:phosphate-selective porin OprO/OprP